VIGPTRDGGYYLIALKQPKKELFEKVEWSTPTVFEKTVDNIQKNGLTFYKAPVLQDIDTYTDLQDLYSQLKKMDKNSEDFPEYTWRCVKELKQKNII
jgi:hypothetical protein